MSRDTVDLEAGIRTYYRRLDETDDALFDDLFAPDGTLTFNGAVVAAGPSDIKAFIREREAGFARITHAIDAVTTDGDGGVAVGEIRVHFAPRDGDTVTVHGCGILEYRGDRIADWRIYVDTGGLPG